MTNKQRQIRQDMRDFLRPEPNTYNGLNRAERRMFAKIVAKKNKTREDNELLAALGMKKSQGELQREDD